MNIEPTSHHPCGPSNFPIWAECIDFEPMPDVKDTEELFAESVDSEEQTDAKARGTAKHKAVAMLLNGDLESRQKALDGLSERERDEVQWVTKTAREIAESNGYSADEIRAEQRVTLFGGGFDVVYFGTCDGEVGPIDMDWKFGLQRNYFPQLAGYALAKMETRQEPRRFGYTIYGALRRVDRYVISLETAQTVVYGLLARRSSAHRKPTPCQYCGWCSKRATCPAIVAMPATIVDRREDWTLKLPSPHVSQLNDPVWLGAARYIWKTYIEPWGNSVEFATSSLSANGVAPAGYKRRTDKGAYAIKDHRKAFQALIPVVGEDVLWQATEITLGSLAKAFHHASGLSEEKAKAAIITALLQDNLVGQLPGVTKLIKEKDAEAIIRDAIERSRVSDGPKKVVDPNGSAIDIAPVQNAPEGAA